ncbi:hypothetical protein ACTFIW_000895 [Dictyostelium discoideum]
MSNPNCIEKKYFCSFCDKSYTRQYHLNVHVNKHHDISKKVEKTPSTPRIPSNPSTPTTSTTLTTPTTPTTTTPTNSIFKCNLCDIQFEKKGQKDYHQSFYHSNSEKTCLPCNQQFSSPSNFKKHVKNLHDGVNHNLKFLENAKKDDPEFIKSMQPNNSRRNENIIISNNKAVSRKCIYCKEIKDIKVFKNYRKCQECRNKSGKIVYGKFSIPNEHNGFGDQGFKSFDYDSDDEIEQY